jgi:phosphoribosylcarboxyaminoimidazole (NCAIR) mutase
MLLWNLSELMLPPGDDRIGPYHAVAVSGPTTRHDGARASGEDDIYAIVGCPENVAVAGASLTAAAGGGTIRTVVLLTPEEVDQVAKKTATYRAPGS